MESSNQKNQSKAQEKARQYIEEHKIEKHISEMLNSLVHARDPHPVIFMIKYLANLATEQELTENGIQVSGQLPQCIPIITYPKFDENCTSLLKKHLTRDIWSNLKKKSTAKGGNIQICVKSGVQMPEAPVGILACDEEAYRSFNDLFGPIIKDLHRDFDFRYSYKFDEMSTAGLTDELASLNKLQYNCDSVKLTLRRNFRGMPFSPLMTREAKLQIERKVVEVLGELYGKYQQLQHLNETDISDLYNSKGIELRRQKLHDAAGINDDYPVGRGIFKEELLEFFVLVNFEDHVQIVVTPNNARDNGLSRAIDKLIKLNKTFERIGFANDAYLGYLTVNPENLGTGLQLEATLQVPSSNSSATNALKTKLQAQVEQKCVKISVSSEPDDCLTVLVQSIQTLAPNYNEIIQMEDFLSAIKTVHELAAVQQNIS